MDWEFIKPDGTLSKYAELLANQKPIKPDLNTRPGITYIKEGIWCFGNTKIETVQIKIDGIWVEYDKATLKPTGLTFNT